MDAGRKLTWTLLIIATLSFLTVSVAHCKDLDGYDGEDWSKWSYEEKIWFTHGMILGSYAVTYGLSLFADGEATANAARFVPFDENIGDVIRAIDFFYATNENDIPIWVAFLNRNGAVKEEIHGNG